MLNGTTGYVNMTQCDLKLLETLNEVPDVGDCLGCSRYWNGAFLKTTAEENVEK